ncbi:MAG: tail fiber domain-containing protein, partial [Paracoccaceae bacterium]
GGVERLEIGSSEVVFNDPSNDVDFRVESNGQTHMLFVDGGNDNILVGTSSAASNSIITVRSASPHLSLYGTPGSNTSQLNLGDTDDHDIGNISYAHSDNSMRFTTNAAERLRIDSSGNLNFAQEASSNYPEQKLKWSNDSTTANGFYISQDSSRNGRIFHEQGLDILFGTNNAERLRIDSSGNVGINNSSPGSYNSDGRNLVVGSGSGGQGLSIASGTSNYGTIYFADGTSGDALYRGAVLYNHASDFMRFDTAAGERLRIDSSGRLLVGTTTSNAAPLTVAGTVGFGDSRFRAVFGDGYLDADSTGTFGAGNSEVQIQTHQNNRPALLSLGGPQGTNEGLGGINFFNSGNTDGKRSRALIYAAQQGSNSDQGGMLLLYTAADGGSSPTERMKIQKDGSFNVYGVYSATGAASANVVVDSGGQLFRSTSSAKYKIDIETIDESYSDALLNCRPVWYRSICSTDNSAHSFWGFIAEEVAEIDPRLVHWKTTEITYDEKSSAVETPCDPEPEGVAYDRFVPHLLNLIKRQKEQIEAMEARLSALEAG